MQLAYFIQNKTKYALSSDISTLYDSIQAFAYIWFQSNMSQMMEHFSTVMLSGAGSTAQWKEMAALNANGVDTNKVKHRLVQCDQIRENVAQKYPQQILLTW